jgi:hypothetical protein
VHTDSIHFLSYLAQFFLKLKIFKKTLCRKLKHIVCVNIFSPENRALYKIMWKNMVELDRSQMKIRRMRIACCIPKATKTFSEYVILIAIPLQQWLHERASMLHYAYMACIVKIPCIWIFSLCYGEGLLFFKFRKFFIYSFTIIEDRKLYV